MKSLDYEKILRFIMIFAIVGISVLVVVVNFMPAFAYDFYDLYPGTEHGRSNFITYPSVLYLFAIYNCFMYLGSNDLKYIDIFILLSILMSIMRIISIFTNGLHVTPFTVLAYPPELLGAPVLFFIKKMIQKKLYKTIS